MTVRPKRGIDGGDTSTSMGQNMIGPYTKATFTVIWAALVAAIGVQGLMPRTADAADLFDFGSPVPVPGPFGGRPPTGKAAPPIASAQPQNSIFQNCVLGKLTPTVTNNVIMAIRQSCAGSLERDITSTVVLTNSTWNIYVQAGIRVDGQMNYSNSISFTNNSDFHIVSVCVSLSKTTGGPVTGASNYCGRFDVSFLGVTIEPHTSGTIRFVDIPPQISATMGMYSFRIMSVAGF